MLESRDTIVAIASAPGGAARGVVRVSGDEAGAIWAACFTPEGARLESLTRPTVVSGRMSLEDGLTVDGHLYFWPGERSYTREPVGEFHTYGSAPLTERIVERLCLAGARPAEPGEFTLRAFFAGRLDLVQAEAVLGVIDAEGRDGLDAAVAQLAGGVSGELTSLRDQLLNVLAEVEAGLDFVEEDIEFISPARITEALVEAAEEVDRVRAKLSGRATVRDAFRVVLYGEPNVGKSRLFNRIVGAEAALVAEVSGTTRDYLVAESRLGSVLVEWIDTAGVEPTSWSVAAREAQGVGMERRRTADLRVLCIDRSREMTAWEREEISKLDPARTVVAWTKCDLEGCGDRSGIGGIETSGKDGRGVEALCDAVAKSAEAAGGGGTCVAMTAARCEASIRRVDEALRSGQTIARTDAGDELLAGELRVAIDALGEIVGAIYTDDLLDRIFGQFCIGK